MTDAEYFALAALSKSQVKFWRPDNPLEFWRHCNFNPEREQVEMTDAMAFGKLSHAMLLTPKIVNDEFEVVDGLGKSRINKKWIEAQAATSKTIVSTEEVERATAMTKAVLQYDIYRELLSGGMNEQPFIWDDAEWGPCKSRLDLIKNTETGLCVVDYKTTGQIDQVTRHIDFAKLHYDVGFYNRAVKVKYADYLAKHEQTSIDKFIFIFQSTKEGEEHLIKVKAVSGAQLGGCDIATEEAVRQIRTRYAAWQKGDATAWLPNPQITEFALSPWIDKEIANSDTKGQPFDTGMES